MIIRSSYRIVCSRRNCQLCIRPHIQETTIHECDYFRSALPLKTAVETKNTKNIVQHIGKLVMWTGKPGMWWIIEARSCIRMWKGNTKNDETNNGTIYIFADTSSDVDDDCGSVKKIKELRGKKIRKRARGLPYLEQRLRGKFKLANKTFLKVTRSGIRVQTVWTLKWFTYSDSAAQDDQNEYLLHQSPSTKFMFTFGRLPEKEVNWHKIAYFLILKWKFLGIKYIFGFSNSRRSKWVPTSPDSFN